MILILLFHLYLQLAIILYTNFIIKLHIIIIGDPHVILKIYNSKNI